MFTPTNRRLPVSDKPLYFRSSRFLNRLDSSFARTVSLAMLASTFLLFSMVEVVRSSERSTSSTSVTQDERFIESELGLQPRRFNRKVAEVLLQSAADGTVVDIDTVALDDSYDSTTLYIDGIYLQKGRWLKEIALSESFNAILNRFSGDTRLQVHQTDRDRHITPYSLSNEIDRADLSATGEFSNAVRSLIDQPQWRSGSTISVVIDQALSYADIVWLSEKVEQATLQFNFELPFLDAKKPLISVVNVRDDGRLDVLAESSSANFVPQYRTNGFPTASDGAPMIDVITVDEGTHLRVIDIDAGTVVGELFDAQISADMAPDWNRRVVSVDAIESFFDLPNNNTQRIEINAPGFEGIDFDNVQRVWLRLPEKYSSVSALQDWRSLPMGQIASHNLIDEIENDSVISIPLIGPETSVSNLKQALKENAAELIIDYVVVDTWTESAAERTFLSNDAPLSSSSDDGTNVQPIVTSSLANDEQKTKNVATAISSRNSSGTVGLRSNTTNVVSSFISGKPTIFGTFDDSFDVGMTGEANYRVPIKLPEAPGGIVPGLSLSYSSAAGQGVAGIGWSLQGLSSIHRCPMSYARDGKHRGVQFDSEDRYCIDGKRLIGTAGSYGTDGAQYRTEQDNFDAVKSQGATIFGPGYWTIQDKAGFDYQFGRGLNGFGDTDEGRIPGVRVNGTNDNRINSWALTRVQDKKGNRFNVKYARSIDSAPQSTADSSFEIEHIQYGTEPSTQVNVLFDYFSQEQDQDGVDEYRYLDDRRFSSNKFLKSINIYRGATETDNLIGTYRFEYSVNADFERWRLVKLQYCGKDQCLQSKSYEWRERPVPGGGGAWDSHGTLTEDNYVVDLNGDGRSDLLGRVNENQWEYCLSTGSNNICYDTTLFDTHYIEPGDYNGDGKTDLIFGTREGDSAQIEMQYCESRLVSENIFGEMTFQCSAVPELNRGPYTNLQQVGDIIDGTSNYAGGRHDNTYQGDFNADGRTDFMRATNNNAFRLCFWQSSGTATFTCRNMEVSREFNIEGQTAYSTFMGGNLIPADFNGDGATDFAVGRHNDIADFSWQICTATDPTRLELPNTATQLAFDCTNRNVPLNTVPLTHVGDFNGDGLADLTRKVGSDDGKWLMCLSTGSTLKCDDWLNGPNVSFQFTIAADLNGDGRTDIAGAETGSSGPQTESWTLGMSTPGGFKKITNVDWTKPEANLGVVGDFNGDGRQEIAGFQEGTDKIQIILSREEVQSLPLLNTVITDDMPSHLSAHHSRALAINYAYEEPESETQRAFPVRQVTRPILVVRSTTTPSHISPVRNSVLYNFSDMRVHVRGLGALGFAARTVEDVQAKTKTESTFSQVYPIVGTQRTQKTFLKLGQEFKELNSTTNTLRVKTRRGAIVNPYTENLNGSQGLLDAYAPYFVFTSESITDTKHYTTGNLLKSERNTHADVSAADYGFDAFGNSKYLKQEIIDRKLKGSDGNDIHWTTTSRSTYAGNGSNGQLSNTQVTYSTNAPGAGVSITKESSFSYDANGQLVTETVEPNSVNGNNQQKSQYLRTGYTYDSYGNESSVLQVGFKHNGEQQNRNTSIETTFFAASADAPDAPPVKRVKTTNALGHISYVEYHLNHGKVVYTKDPNGFESHWKYDEFGGYVDTTSHIGVREWIEFHDYVGAGDSHAPVNAFTKLMERETGQLRVTSYFDSNGNLLRKMTGGFTAGDVIYVDADYDRLNRKTVETVPYYRGEEGNETTYQYWGFTNKPKTVTNADDTLITYAYGDNWSKSTTTGTSMLDLGEEENHTRIQQQFYYANGSIHQVRNGPTVGYSKLLKRYDALGRLRFTQDDSGNRIVITYDLRDRKIRQVDPDMGRWDYRYTSYGELGWQRDAKLNVTTNLYDELGRLTSTINVDGRTNRYYDQHANSIGQQTREIHLVPGQQAHYRLWTWYNVKGLPSRQDTCIGNGRTTGVACPAGSTSRYRFNYTYDGVGRPRKLTYPGGKVLEHKYLRGHMSELLVNDQQIWRVDSKTALGQTKLQTHGNGLKTDYAYDQQNRLRQINVDNNGSSSLLKRYEYHLSDGSLKLRHDFNHDIQEYFGYDAHGRLQNQHLLHGGGSSSNKYEYDVLGNLVSKPDLAELVGKTFSYGENGAGPHALTSIGDRTFLYDANGNVTNDGKRSMAWTAFNKPASITSNSDSTNKTEFVYGSGFKRVMRINGDSTITYLDASFASNAHYEEEQTAQGISKKWYYSIGGRTIAIDSTDTTGQDKRLYAHHDRLGSIVGLSDINRTIVERMSYDPWGKRRQLIGAESNNISGQNILHGFTGHEMLDEHGLIHMNGRINDPSLGRFLSADPFIQYSNNPQSYNRYSYILNDPLGGTDPTGYLRLSKNQTIAVIGLAVAIIVTGGAAAPFGGLAALSIGQAVLVGALAGAASSATTTFLSGGGMQNILEAGARGALIGGLAAGVAFNVGTIGTAPGETLNGSAKLLKTLAHGATQGMVSAVGGGSFKSSFIGAVAGSLTPSRGNIYSKTATSAFSGGVAAYLSGGKFSTGAYSAAFVRMFNHIVHDPTPAPGIINPVPDEYRELATEVVKAANQAKAEIDSELPWLNLPGLRWLRGIKIHNRMADIIDSLESDLIHSEVSYYRGRVERYGYKNSIRADAVIGPEDAPFMAFDLKTGNAYISTGQHDRYILHLPYGTGLRELTVDRPAIPR